MLNNVMSNISYVVFCSESNVRILRHPHDIKVI